MLSLVIRFTTFFPSRCVVHDSRPACLPRTILFHFFLNISNVCLSPLIFCLLYSQCKRQRSLRLCTLFFGLSFAICAAHCFKLLHYIDWQQCTFQLLARFFPSHSLQTIRRHTKKCSDFFSFASIRGSPPVCRIVLIIIQDQVYWRKLSYNEKITHDDIHWAVIKIEMNRRKTNTSS